MAPSPLVTTLLLVLHVGSAAYWFGLVAGLPRRVRALLGGADAELRSRILARDVRGAALAPVVAWLTGLALVFAVGGFSVVAPRFHTAMAVGLAWVGLGWTLGRTVAGVVEAPPADEADRRRVRARVGALAGMGHLLWVTLLVLMVYRG